MNEVLAGLSVVSTICAIVFGYVAFARNGKRDVADEAKSDATVLTENRLHQGQHGRNQGGAKGTAQNER